MAQYAYGERIGRTAQLKLGCAAIIPDDTGKKIVLTRRTDNGRWCLPGGAMDPGESLEEMAQLDMIDPHRERVHDFLVGQEAAFVR